MFICSIKDASSTLQNQKMPGLTLERLLPRCCVAGWMLLVLGNPFVTVQAHPEYRDRIPNGYNVKDTNGEVWAGVGHYRSEGSGPRNPFGEDFAAAGFQWTTALCQKDSDSDGASNGVELGDPHCVWTPGATPSGPAVSHPGFPGDALASVDTCRDFHEPPGAVNITVQFTSPFTLPEGVVTTYPRQGVDLSTLANWQSGQDHFALRFETLYGGPVNVVHHIVIYQCTLTQLNNGGYQLADPPKVGCGMPCSAVLYAWAIGGKPFCLPSKHAMRFRDSSSFILFEVHMNNAAKDAGILSQPGFKITVVPENAVTPNSLREVSWVMLGAQLELLSIPPRQGYVEITANFTAFPTGPGDAYMTFIASFSHMHYLGRKIWVESRSSQRQPQNLACNPKYTNEDQEVIPMNPPLNVTANDTVVVHCVYNSSLEVNATTGGEETTNEMCFVFLLFYSNVISGPLQAQAVPYITTTPQTTTVACEAASSNTGGPLMIPLPSWLLAHVICAAFGVGFLMPIGAMFPASRAFRRKRPTAWFLGHRVFVLTGATLAATAFALGVSYNSNYLTSSHGRMGLAIIALCVFQILLGALRPHLPVDSTQVKSKARKAFEWIHPSTGWIIMGCAAVQINWGYGMLYDLYWNVSGLLYWRWVHSVGFFCLWAVAMVLLHPPPFIRSGQQHPQQVTEKQITTAV